MKVRNAECLAAGIDPAIVRRLSLTIERAALEAQALGIQVFGGDGSGSLRASDDVSRAGKGGALILADLQGNWSGGDGGQDPFSPDLFVRGER